MKQSLLGTIQHRVEISRLIQSQFVNVTSRFNQPAQRGLVSHNLTILLYVGRRGHSIDQLSQVGTAANGL